MRAVVAHAAKDYRFVTDLPVPKPGPLDVLVKVTAVGICASDVKMYQGGSLYWHPKTGRARPPVIPGHEFVGIVAELGKGSAEEYGLKVGDPVVCEQIYACHKCWFCKHELPNKCDDLRIYGQAVDGACADYMLYKKGSYIYKCPDGMPAYQGVLVEPVAVSVHAMDRAKLEDNMTILISGAGPIGLGVVASVRRYFPSITIIVIDYHQFKLDLAKTIGAHHVYNLSDLSAPEILSRIVAEVVTDGRGGPDVYFECTGNPSSIPQGLSLVRKCGTFCHVGICKQPDCCADWNAISAGKELTVIGSNLGYGCWDRAFDIVASGVMDPIVTHAYTLEEYIDALELVQDPIDCIKVIVDPTVERSGLTEWGKKIVPKDLADGSARKEKMAKELAEKEKSSADSMGRLDGYSLEGKVVLITGASAGIGEACAREFAAKGANLVLAARRLDRLETLTAELSSKYPSIKIHNLQLDVRTKAAVDAAIASLPAAFAEIAVLVNNAGLTIGVDLVENVPEDVINTIIDTNVKGLLFVSQAVIPGMRQRDRGHIINIGSISGKDVYSGGGIYCGSKFFVDALNKSLTLELLNTKIRVTEISPGMADSDFITVRFGGDESAKDKWYQGFTPLRPKDVADFVVFAATRPEHVQIGDCTILPSCQASVHHVARKAT